MTNSESEAGRFEWVLHVDLRDVPDDVLSEQGLERKRKQRAEAGGDRREIGGAEVFLIGIGGTAADAGAVLEVLNAHVHLAEDLRPGDPIIVACARCKLVRVLRANESGVCPRCHAEPCARCAAEIERVRSERAPFEPTAEEIEAEARAMWTAFAAAVAIPPTAAGHELPPWEEAQDEVVYAPWRAVARDGLVRRRGVWS